MPSHAVEPESQAYCASPAPLTVAQTAQTVNPDSIFRPSATGGSKARIDTAEVLIDLPQIRAARVKVDRKINRAARRLPDPVRLARGAERIAIARCVR